MRQSLDRVVDRVDRPRPSWRGRRTPPARTPRPAGRPSTRSSGGSARWRCPSRRRRRGPWWRRCPGAPSPAASRRRSPRGAPQGSSGPRRHRRDLLHTCPTALRVAHQRRRRASRTTPAEWRSPHGQDHAVPPAPGRAQHHPALDALGRPPLGHAVRHRRQARVLRRAPTPSASSTPHRCTSTRSPDATPSVPRRASSPATSAPAVPDARSTRSGATATGTCSRTAWSSATRRTSSC